MWEVSFGEENRTIGKRSATMSDRFTALLIAGISRIIINTPYRVHKDGQQLLLDQCVTTCLKKDITIVLMSKDGPLEAV